MSEEHTEQSDLRNAIVRICVTCGVVNPAGPSDACPHVQLARFNGVDDGFAGLLTEVARARRDYLEKVTALKERVRAELRNHRAEIETPRHPRPSEVDNLRLRPSKTPPLHLKSPTPPPAQRRGAKRAPTRTSKPPAVDPRQLELLIREPPKGDA